MVIPLLPHFSSINCCFFSFQCECSRKTKSNTFSILNNPNFNKALFSKKGYAVTYYEIIFVLLIKISTHTFFMNKYLLLIILLFCALKAVAQHPVLINSDNGSGIFVSLEKARIENLYKTYSVGIESSYELIKGREYITYYQLSEYKPILFNDKKHLSSITMKGRKYDDVILNYDTYKDQIIYSYPAPLNIYSPLQVALNNYNMDCFELYYADDTISFRYFSKDSNSGFNLPDGFYEVVLDGTCKYLIKHKSAAYTLNNTIEYNYTPLGYISVCNGFSKITNTRHFIKLFGEKSDEIRKFVKRSGIKIRLADKKQISSVLLYYNSLVDQNK
jgi:hypothetical protein